MIKKRLFLIILLLCVFISVPVYAEIKVVLDNQELQFDVPPVNKNGRLLVPVRAIFEALGAEVNWDGETQTVKAVKGETEIKLVVGGTAVKNGSPVTIDVPADNISGRVMVPLRFVSEALGAEVAWSDANQCAYISDINRVAMKIHEDAWLEVASKAKDNPNYKYALYASRTLAVKHPEYYLKGDAMFNDYFRTLSEKYYLDRTQNSYKQPIIFEEIKINSGNKFNWDTSFNIKNHKKVGYNIYHTDAFLPYVDMRLHFLGSALKGTDWQATSISKAEFLYFKYHDKKPYLVFTDDGTAYTYLSLTSQLLSDNNSEIDNFKGNVVLIFNENNVWYPLMGRDDRALDPVLGKIVEKYTSGEGLPVLNNKEKKIVQFLRESTDLQDDLDRTWALFYSAKLHLQDWRKYPAIYAKICSGYGPIENTNTAPMVLLTRDSYVVYISNLICPAASYLASIAKFYMMTEPQQEDTGLILLKVGKEIANSNLKYVSTNIPQSTSLVITDIPSNYYFNMDDTYLAKVSICIYASIQDMSILTLADLPGVEYFSAAIHWTTRDSGHAVTPVYYKKSVGAFENLAWRNSDYLCRKDYIPTLTAIINKNGWLLLSESPYFKKPNDQLLTNMTENEVWNILNKIKELSPECLITTKREPGHSSEGIKITDFMENANRYRIIRSEW